MHHHRLVGRGLADRLQDRRHGDRPAGDRGRGARGPRHRRARRNGVPQLTPAALRRGCAGPPRGGPFSLLRRDGRGLRARGEKPHMPRIRASRRAPPGCSAPSHGSPPHHRAHRPDQRAGAAHSRVAAGDRALVPARVDGAHAAVLHLGRPAQRRLQAGAGGHQPVSRRLQQPDHRNAAAGGAGGDGGDREDLPRSEEPAADSGAAHPQLVLPDERAAPDGDLPPGRAQRAPGHARRVAHRADPGAAARRQRADRRAAGAHAAPPRAEGLRSLHDPAQQRPVGRHSEGAGEPARAVPAAAAARRLGGAAARPTTSPPTRRWRRSSPSCSAWTRG